MPGTGQFVGNGRDANRLTVDDNGPPVTLNLVDVPIREATKVVLSDILKIEYSIDAGVDGRVTLQTAKPISRFQMLQMFQSSLRANGAAIVNQGGQLRLTSAERAIAASPILTSSAPVKPGAVGAVVRVVELKFVSALEMKRILEPMAPQGSIIRADAERNVLTLSGSSTEVHSLLEAITIFDIDVMRGMSFAMVPVTTSQPSTIAEELTRIFGADKEGPMSGMVRFLPNRRLASILIVSPQAQYLKRGEEWVRRLDARAQSHEKQFYTYKVRNRRAQELVDVMQSILAGDRDRSTRKQPERSVTPRQPEVTQRSSGFLSAGLGASTNENRADLGQSASERSETSTAVAVQHSSLSEEAEPRVVADKAKNTILIDATPKDHKRILRLIERLDVAPNQVVLEATIAEVSLNDQLKFGVRWYLEKRNSTLGFSDAASGTINSVFPGFSYALATANLASTVNALNEVTDVTIVSSPSLTVMDNKTAVLQIGDQVPIATQSAVSVISPDSPVVNSVSYKDTGVILSMTPQISDSGRVMLEIEQEVSSVSTTSTSGIDSPTIRQRRVKTTVVVNDGEALALGGLIQKSRTNGRSQVPILGDIPIVGRAFQQNDNDLEKTELIIIITPHVLRNPEEARAVTEELRQQFETHVREDREFINRFDRRLRRAIH